MGVLHSRSSNASSRPRRTVVLAFAILASAVGGCITEPPGPPSIETSFGTTLTLTADRPVAMRSFDYLARAGSQEVGSVSGYVEVVGTGGGGPGGEQHPDVWVSILNLDTGDSVDSRGGIGHASVDGWGHHAPCDGKPAINDDGHQVDPAPPCQARWTVITRWLEPEPGTEISLEINASMTAYARARSPEGEDFALDAFAITEAEVPAPDGGPAVTRAAVRGSTRVTVTSARETHRFLLRVPAALLDGEPGFPRLGRVFFGTDVTEWSGPPAYLHTELSIDGDTESRATGPSAAERDWLARCDPGRDCDLAITLTIEPESSSQVATIPPDGVIAIDWVIEARYEDFSAGATLPAQLELLEAP